MRGLAACGLTLFDDGNWSGGAGPSTSDVLGGLDLYPTVAIDRQVYRCGSGPPVLVLHEILGLTPGVTSLARRLASNGFAVYTPLLFGGPGSVSFFSGWLRSCGSGDFVCSAPAKSSRIVGPLGTLAVEIAARHRGRVGVIGMCLTGVFPLSLMRHREVVAPVLCQPTVPFGLIVTQAERKDLGLSPADLAVVKSRTDIVLGMRFTGDRRCPPERFWRLEQELGPRFEGIEIHSGHDGVPHDAHSVLTSAFVDDSRHPTYRAFRRTVEFLTAALA